MTFEDHVKLLRRYWALFLACVAVGLVVSGAVFSVKPPVYTAKSIIYIAGRGGDTPAAAYEGAQVALLQVKSYPQLIKSNRVASEVVAQLGLQESPEQLMKQITAQNTLDSLLLDVAVTAPSPAEAVRIANTVDNVFKDLVEQLETRGTGVPAVEAFIVQRATASTEPSSLGLPTVLVLGLVGGLLAGLGACIARDRLGRLVESARQDEVRSQATRGSANDILLKPLEDRGQSVLASPYVDQQ